MAFQHSRTVDHRRAAAISYEYYNSYGKLERTAIDTSPKCIGTFKTMNYNKTVDYLPGRFSVNPVEQSKLEIIDSRPEKGAKLLVWDSFFKRYSVRRVVDGNICSYLRQYSDNGVTTPTSVIRSTKLQRDQALIGAYAKVDKADFDTALWIAELRDTIELLRNPFMGLRKLMNEFVQSSRKMSKYGAKTLAESATSQWMEYRYGIMPLILDIEAIKTLYEEGITRHERPMERATRRIVSSAELAPTTKVEKTFDRTAHMFFLKYAVRKYIHTAVVGRVFYRRTSGVWETMSRIGIAPQKVFTLLWELKRLSFVWDWVFGIGDWLEAVLPKPGVDILGNCISLKTTEVSTISGLTARYSNTLPMSDAPITDMTEWVSQETHSSYERITAQPLPTHPVLAAEIVNLRRSLDSLSLFWQSMPKKLKR